MATEEDVVKVMRYLVAAWPRTEVSEQTVAVYGMHMLRTRLPADVLLLAAINLVDNLQFFPSVAEWRAESLEIASRRQWWQVTSNYRENGEALPEELVLPARVFVDVFGYEPALLEDGYEKF